jgi:hypothetical protein
MCKALGCWEGHNHVPSAVGIPVYHCIATQDFVYLSGVCNAAAKLRSPVYPRVMWGLPGDFRVLLPWSLAVASRVPPEATDVVPQALLCHAPASCLCPSSSQRHFPALSSGCQAWLRRVKPSLCLPGPWGLIGKLPAGSCIIKMHFPLFNLQSDQQQSSAGILSQSTFTSKLETFMIAGSPITDGSMGPWSLSVPMMII